MKLNEKYRVIEWILVRDLENNYFSYFNSSKQ